MVKDKYGLDTSEVELDTSGVEEKEVTIEEKKVESKEPVIPKFEVNQMVQRSMNTKTIK